MALADRLMEMQVVYRMFEVYQETVELGGASGQVQVGKDSVGPKRGSSRVTISRIRTVTR